MSQAAHASATPLRLELTGRVDIGEVRALHARALAACEQPADVLVDWAGVELLDGAGLQVLLALHAALRAVGRRLLVTAAPPPVAESLALAGVAGVFTLAEDMAS